MAAASCLGYFSGNDSVDALGALPGVTNWLGLNPLTQYKDDRVSAGSTTTSLFDVLRSTGDESKGELRFLQSLTGPFVLTLKGGSNWAAYYLASGAKAGDVLTFDIPGENGRGLSHASIYTSVTPVTPVTPVAPRLSSLAAPTGQPVPEPGSMALVLGALAALGLSRRRAAARG